MREKLKAPFPWFGGKSKVSHLVWMQFGDVRNYVEPFAGSLAVLLGRPTAAKIETVNDIDCMIANFWRAIHADPQRVASFADWPVNECDLHARHLWLVKQITQTEFRERIKTDPDFFDSKIAGWWVWGICQWIGSGWCSRPDWEGRGNSTTAAARGISGLITPGRTNAGRAPRGVAAKRPRLGNDAGRGALSVANQIPDLSGDSGAAGRGIHASASDGIYGWFDLLSNRLRRVRVCCGDWRRILGPAPTTCIGTTGVFLDPPYAVEDRSDVYNEESREIAHDVRRWAIENGDNPELRIALCGYESEHAMPPSWSMVAWKSNGGFGNQANGDTRGRKNARRERIWFSPHCLRPQEKLFT